MHNPKMVSMIKEIQAVDFALYELALYLNTHPDDRRALEDHNKLAQRSHQLKAEYEQKFGPLTLNSYRASYPYNYIDDPWPWEIRY